ncbi:MAG: DUF1800 family protein, partial [Acidobacteriota bacterium]
MRGDLPWSAHGWSEAEAAAHLLERFTFGPRPGDLARVRAQGLDAWFDAQLAARLSEDDLERRTRHLDALDLRGEALLD